MRRNEFGSPGIPLFFKLWFAFVAIMAISIFAGSIFMTVKIFGTLQDASPQALGSALGKAVAAYQKESK